MNLIPLLPFLISPVCNILGKTLVKCVNYFVWQIENSSTAWALFYIPVSNQSWNMAQTSWSVPYWSQRAWCAWSPVEKARVIPKQNLGLYVCTAGAVSYRTQVTCAYDGSWECMVLYFSGFTTSSFCRLLNSACFVNVVLCSLVTQEPSWHPC